MSKYDPLRCFLENASLDMVEMVLSFMQIEQIVGDALPYTARNHGSWWANELRPGTHSQSSSWLDAGWKVEAVERDHKWVRFRRLCP